VRNDSKWVSILLIAFLLILTLSFVGCSDPGWCNEKLRLYRNVEYGYELYFPPSSELTTYWGGSAHVFIDDGVSEIDVDVYGWGNVSQRADDFLKLMESRNEEKGTIYEYIVGANMNWNYEVEAWFDKDTPWVYKSDRSAEIHYTCLKAVYEGAKLEPVKNVKVNGEIAWYKGNYGDKEYIYCFQYETPVDCECCNRLLDISALEFCSYISGQ
jgi:hypothetical protein